MGYMYRITCEWDIGQEYLVFTTAEEALNWAMDNFDEVEMEMTFEEAQGDGLIGWQELEIVS